VAIRSFLAFDLPEELAQLVARTSEELRKSGLGVRWIDPAKIHLTVVFLGDMEEGSIKAIGDSVRGVCSTYGPFEAMIKSAGYFGPMKSPRVLWMGMAGDIERMGRFRDSLQKALKSYGIKEENRPFRPHITLGRFRQGAGGGDELGRIMSRYKDIESAKCRFTDLAFYRSDLKPSGPVYSELGRWTLAGGL
jgi:2'-5' RNA ligase